MQSKLKNKIVVLAFQLCVITNSVFGGDAALFQVSRVIMLLFFAIMAFVILLRGGKILVGKSIVFPALFTLYMIVSVLWAYNRSYATSQLVTQLQLIILLVFTYLAMLDGAEIKDYLDAIYIAGWGMTAFALVRYGGLENFIQTMEEGTRMGGEITNQNTFGLLFSKAALAAAYYLIVRKKKVHIVSIAIFAFFTLSSGSKKATLLIVVGVLAIAIVHNGIRKLYKTILIGAVVLVAAWYALQLPIFSTINARLTSFLSGELGGSDQVRQNMITYGWLLFWDKPIFGYGLNNYMVLYPGGLYSHNNFIEVLVSGGIVGFVLYYLMYAVPLFGIFLGKDRKKAWHDSQYLMLLVWLAIDLIFGYGMVQLYGKTSHILLGVALAALDKLKMNRKSDCIGQLEQK